jgi:hypothetical protein
MAGSNPDEVIEFLSIYISLLESFQPHNDPGVYSAPNKVPEVLSGDKAR